MKKKLPKLRKPNLPAAIKRRKSAEDKAAEALANVPRITNETVAEHREEVLGGARKYIYPLQHSKKRLVKLSVSVVVLAIVLFLVGTVLALYKFQSTSGFMHGVTQVVPFPAAKAGSSWVSYDSYLFELRRTMHYYTTQQGADFKHKDQPLLKRLKQQAMDQVIQDAYIKQLAKQNKVKVTDAQVNAQINMLRQQNRLGSSDREFANVLGEFWGWSPADFKRAIKQQLLAQAVVSKLDVQTQSRAAVALKQLQDGADFAAVATSSTDDSTTKNNGGQFAGVIAANDTAIPPAIVSQLFKLKDGQISGVVDSGYSLEILKRIATQGDKIQAAHIQFNLQPVSTYTDPVAKAQPAHRFIQF